MLRPTLTQPSWLQIPQSARLELIKLFNLERDCNREMVANKVKSDGYSNTQLEKITIEGLKENGCIGSDIFELINDFIDKHDSKYPTPVIDSKYHIDSAVEQFTHIFIGIEKLGLTQPFKERVLNLLGVKKPGRPKNEKHI